MKGQGFFTTFKRLSLKQTKQFFGKYTARFQIAQTLICSKRSGLGFYRTLNSGNSYFTLFRKLSLSENWKDSHGEEDFECTCLQGREIS